MMCHLVTGEVEEQLVTQMEFQVQVQCIRVEEKRTIWLECDCIKFSVICFGYKGGDLSLYA